MKHLLHDPQHMQRGGGQRCATATLTLYTTHQNQKEREKAVASDKEEVGLGQNLSNEGMGQVLNCHNPSVPPLPPPLSMVAGHKTSDPSGNEKGQLGQN